MIVIEADALLTIGMSLAGAVLGALLSWWFTRRHYSRARPRALTAEDVEIAKARFCDDHEGTTISRHHHFHNALIHWIDVEAGHGWR